MFVRVALLAALLLGACARPSEEECRKAVENLQKLTGTEENATGPDPNAYIRRCRSTGSRDGVQCIIRAKTLKEAQACRQEQ